jgi:hypothetical protein
MARPAYARRLRHRYSFSAREGPALGELHWRGTPRSKFFKGIFFVAIENADRLDALLYIVWTLIVLILYAAVRTSKKNRLSD